MRALTQDEYAVLNHAPTGIEYQPGDSVLVVAERLIKRGCMAAVAYPSAADPGRVGYVVTDLGRLALRVSRPEMAYKVST